MPCFIGHGAYRTTRNTQFIMIYYYYYLFNTKTVTDTKVEKPH